MLALLGRRSALAVVAPVLVQHQLKPAPARAEETPVPGLTVSRLRYFDFGTGEGPRPRWGQLIRFHYVGYSATDDYGTLQPFDSSYSRGTPYLTKHGNGFTAQGLEEALHTMRPGGKRRVILPAEYGFTADKGPLPPGNGGREVIIKKQREQRLPLVYDLELLSAADDLFDLGFYDQDNADEDAARQAVNSPS